MKMDITVKHPKRHPDCEYCDAEARALENYRHLVADAKKKIKEQALEIQRLREAMSGWENYGWKNGKYVDSLDEYFQYVLDGKYEEAAKFLDSGDSS